MQPWLLITSGLPFSGKSTLALVAADVLDMLRVSVDDQHALDALAGGQSSDADWLAAYASALRQTEKALGSGTSVLFDSVGHTRKNRHRLRRLAARHGARFGIIHLAVSRNEALARLTANQVVPSRPDVPLSSFERIASEFELPGQDEPVIMFEPRQDVRTWVDTVLRQYISVEGDR